jgi:nitrite reductase (NADH) small subunit
MDGGEDELFIPVARLGDLDERGRAVVRVGGESVALVRVDGRLHALQDACPHRGGPLSEGDLSGCLLYCPLHAWAFDVRTGSSPTHPGARVRIYAVRIIGEEIHLAASARVRAPLAKEPV